MTKNACQNVKKSLRKKLRKRNTFRKTHRKHNKRNSNHKSLNMRFNKRRTGGSPTTPPENDFDDSFIDDSDNIPEIESSNTPEEVTNPTKEEIDHFTERVKKSQASRKISNLITKNITSRRTAKTTAMNTIGRFFKNVNPDKRRAYFLKSVCSDSGVCIAFGKETNRIKKHFDNFTNFKYLVGDAKTIGIPSANGFVKELSYYNEGYRAYAILKSTTRPVSDNLLYEAYVGNYLNRVGLQYPCFLETYGAYQYNTEEAYVSMKTNKFTPISTLTAGMQEVKNINTAERIDEACKYPLFATSLLIQHLRDVTDVNSQLTNDDFLRNDLMYVLFQVYAPLALLSSTFTHYDLHTNNILLYEPVKGSYIEYHYNIKGTVISFKSKYIAKIIDYGRCFFIDNKNNTFSGSSEKIYNDVCSTSSCNPNCGEDFGFTFLEYIPSQQKQSFYISSQRPNQSHDLRALDMISNMSNNYLKHAPKDLQTILQKVHYEDNYGTPASESGLPTKIKNVSDALTSLSIIHSEENVAKNNENYASLTKLGDLYIFDSGESMKYEPVV